MIHRIHSLEQVSSAEHFYIDANVLYFIHFYNQDSEINKSKALTYLEFISKLQNNGNQLFISVLNLQELVFVIEKAELRKFCKSKNSQMTLKKYRDNSDERRLIQEKLKFVIQQICSIYSITNEYVDLETIRLLVETYHRHHFDPIDFLTVCPKCRTCKTVNQNFNFISDDSDFKKNQKFNSDPNINLYTL